MKMNHPYIKVAGAVVAVCALSALIGGVAGSLAGGNAAKSFLDSQKLVQGLHLPNGTSTQADKEIATPTTTTQIKLVSMSDAQGVLRTVPENVLTRKSPTAALYIHRRGTQDTVLKISDQVARAVAVTADGWFVTAATAFDETHAVDMVLWYDHKAYKINQAIMDKATGAVFIKTDAKDLPSVAFTAASAKRAGSSVWIESDPYEFMQSSLSAYRLADSSSVASSDKVDRRLVAQADLKTFERGSALWDENGSLLGVVEKSENGRALAISSLALSASLQGLMSDGQIKHASLGVNSLDLASVRLASADENMPIRGSWLKDDKKIAPVIRGGAGEKSGLKSGDVILRIDRDILDGSLDLSDLVMQYKPGVTVTFRVWRQGKELDVPVTFGTQTTGQVLP